MVERQPSLMSVREDENILILTLHDHPVCRVIDIIIARLDVGNIDQLRGLALDPDHVDLLRNQRKIVVVHEVLKEKKVNVIQVQTPHIHVVKKFQIFDDVNVKRKEMSMKVNFIKSIFQEGWEFFKNLQMPTSTIVLNLNYLFFHLEIAKKYPPSLRLIVIESDKMETGTLFVVTYKGGSLGREGKHHTVLIPDVNVSKNHLKFSYDKKRGNYQIIDYSRNGSLIDGKQISSLSQEDSEAVDLFHDNILQVSNTRLLCHVHEGLSTCNDCEPFNYIKPQKEPEKITDDPQPSNLSHKEQLKLLQKRYGLQSEKYQENSGGGKNKNYEDRAESRRVKVGSSHHAEKTVQASVNTSISSDNKGFKLLSKMGWKEGKSIGKDDEKGIKEPVQLKSQQGTSGLGNERVQISTSFNIKKREILNKTQQRYNNINKDENIFED